MKKFILASIAINLGAIILLFVLIILPRLFYGLAGTPQLIMEFSLLIIVLGQIISAIIWKKKYNGSIIMGVWPILIPLWYYFEVVRPMCVHIK